AAVPFSAVCRAEYESGSRFTRTGRVPPLDPVDRSARILRRARELLFDAQQLIVLRDAVGSARRAGLDLARARADSEIGDERVFRFARAMRDHGQIPGSPRHVDRLE